MFNLLNVIFRTGDFDLAWIEVSQNDEERQLEKTRHFAKLGRAFARSAESTFMASGGSGRGTNRIKGSAGRG